MKLNESIENIQNNVQKSLTDITKCYILINYAHNTDEEQKLYKQEFQKRYINFYRNIVLLSEQINETYEGSMKDLFKKILDLDFYQSKMNFLDTIDLGNDIEENNQEVDSDYNRKASMSQVKLNFYHNNKVEFGLNTRFHVDTSRYSTIDPEAKNNEEKENIFCALTFCFRNNYLKDYKKKLILEDM